MQRTLGPTAFIVALTLAGCGNGSEAQFRDQMIETGATDAQVDCMLEGFEALGVEVDDLTDRAIETSGASEESIAVVAECMGGGVIDLSPIDTDADDYGDDPILDELWDRCADGEGDSCDSLYFQSPPGSGYGTFADTCGDRFETSPGLCGEVELD